MLAPSTGAGRVVQQAKAMTIMRKKQGLIRKRQYSEKGVCQLQLPLHLVRATETGRSSPMRISRDLMPA